MIEFQVVSWDAEDDEEMHYRITLFGRTADDQSVACYFHFRPYFFVEAPSHQMSAIVSAATGCQYKPCKDHVVMDGTDACAMVKRKKFYGFTNDKEYSFVRLVFESKKAWKAAFWTMKKQSKYKNRIYEANIDPVLRFIHVQQLETAGWVRVHDNKYDEIGSKITTCDIEVEVSDWRNVLPVDRPDIGPLRMASFDIETYSPDGAFPDPNKECPVFQIATTYQKYGSPDFYRRELISFGKCDPIENVDVICVKSESELIKTWCKQITQHDPDVMIGYNIWKFDLWYLYVRATKFGMEHLFNINRWNSMNSKMYTAKFSSSAYGDNEYNMVQSTGRMQIDLLEVYKRDHKLVSYSLNAVSDHFLKDKKVDLSPKEMFRKYESKDPSQMAEVGVYCVKDTELPLLLMHKLSNVPNLVEMAKATYVPMNYLIERGQQIKVFSQITKQTRIENMLVITMTDGKTNESFVGATVLNAEKGAYMSEVVTGLDFASLYPSIMRAHNLCYNTIVLDDQHKNLPGVEYETIAWDDHAYTFAQTKQGILPKLLENLAKNRKQAKKDMALAKDPLLKSVYNGKQLAFKVSMNSIYGFCVAFMLPCQEISACVTTVGRQMIEKTKNLVEEWYPGSRVIYGDTDSVMVIFNNDLKESFRLGEEAAARITKTFKRPIELAFEKCYWPYLLFSKKRYAGLMYTNVDAPDYVDAKGIQLVRRDNAPFVREVSKTILNMIMYERKIIEAMAYAQEQAKRLLDNEVDIDQLVVSKSLRTGYKNDNQPHIHVARKMETRQPGSGPKSGERVPYVFVQTNNKNDLQYLKAEDPVYVKENHIQLDLMYYLKHSLMSPIESLFELFMDNPGKELFDEYIHEYNRKQKGQYQIGSFFGKEVIPSTIKALPTGSKPTKSRQTSKTSQSGIRTFFV